MNNPYQGGTAPPVDNESGSEEDDVQVPPQHAGGFGSGTHQQPNMMMHGGVPMHPSQQWPQQSSALSSFNSNNPAQQYGSQQYPGMNMPSPTGSFNSNPNSMGSFNSNPNSMGSFNSNPQFGANPQQPNMGMMQQQPSNHLPQLFQLMQQQPNNPMVAQLFLLAQQQPNNPMLSQMIQLAQQQPNNPMLSQMIQMALQQPPPAMPTMMQQNTLNRNMSSNPSMLSSSPSMSMPGFQPNPGYGPNQGQTPLKTTGRRNSRTSNASGLSNTNVMQPPAFVSYYVHEERVTYPVSMNQNGAHVMPFMLEACVDMDLQRKRLSLMDCEDKSSSKKIVRENRAVAIDYGKLVEKLKE
uniref:Clathrin assembly protein n=1 Tax=Globodera pallida TaxID=36090 RepID=A0A183CPM7_GLOPA